MKLRCVGAFALSLVVILEEVQLNAPSVNSSIAMTLQCCRVACHCDWQHKGIVLSWTSKHVNRLTYLQVWIWLKMVEVG